MVPLQLILQILMIHILNYINFTKYLINLQLQLLFLILFLISYHNFCPTHVFVCSEVNCIRLPLGREVEPPVTEVEPPVIEVGPLVREVEPPVTEVKPS